MKRMNRAIALLLILLLAFSGFTLAEDEQGPAFAVSSFTDSSSAQAQETENSSVHAPSSSDDALVRQIQDTYKAAKKRSRRSSFKGYCGAYVANQLVILGINTSYLSANGKNTYDIYRNMEMTTGGYRVTAYGAKKYTLSEALSAIAAEDPSARNILVGFQKGVSSSGRKYGHVLFIHGIKSGKVYFSDSSSRTIEDIEYKEGEPIVCSLTAFVNQYAKYKLDGVVHFKKADLAASSSSTAGTASASSENTAAEG